jgi:hypothetical protein
MKTKTLSLLFLLSAFLAAIYFLSCGNDNTVTGSSGSYPNIQMKAGSVYYYGTDSISQNGTYHNTNWRTKDSIWASTTFNGKNCFPIFSLTQDTLPSPPWPTITSQMIYISYDASSGIFYQWAIKRIFDTTQAASWDEITDFSKSIGTSVPVFTLNSLFGNSLLSANVSSKVAVDTVLVTHTNSSVNCYRVELTAIILVGGQLQVGTARVDYYIGYTPSNNPSNPSGRIRFKFYPLNLSNYGVILDGVDQVMRNYTLP